MRKRRGPTDGGITKITQQLTVGKTAFIFPKKIAENNASVKMFGCYGKKARKRICRKIIYEEAN